MARIHSRGTRFTTSGITRTHQGLKQTSDSPARTRCMYSTQELQGHCQESQTDRQIDRYIDRYVCSCRCRTKMRCIPQMKGSQYQLCALGQSPPSNGRFSQPRSLRYGLGSVGRRPGPSQGRGAFYQLQHPHSFCGGLHKYEIHMFVYNIHVYIYMYARVHMCMCTCVVVYIYTYVDLCLHICIADVWVYETGFSSGLSDSLGLLSTVVRSYLWPLSVVLLEDRGQRAVEAQTERPNCPHHARGKKANKKRQCHAPHTLRKSLDLRSLICTRRLSVVFASCRKGGSHKQTCQTRTLTHGTPE